MTQSFNHDNPLIELARTHYRDDQANVKDDCYFDLYHEVFAPLRNRELWIMEIGVAAGCSAKIWCDYFAMAHIVGLDKNQPSLGVQELISSGQMIYIRGDQGDADALQMAIDRTPHGAGFDIIIDDAAHTGSLAKKSFGYLFPVGLKPGGMYFIEDFGTGYFPDWADSREYCEFPDRDSADGLPQKFESHQYGMVGFIKQLIDELHAAEIRPRERPRFDMASIRLVPNLMMITKAGR
jgi:hypothetical protein